MPLYQQSARSRGGTLPPPPRVPLCIAYVMVPTVEVLVSSECGCSVMSCSKLIITVRKYHIRELSTWWLFLLLIQSGWGKNYIWYGDVQNSVSQVQAKGVAQSQSVDPVWLKGTVLRILNKPGNLAAGQGRALGVTAIKNNTIPPHCYISRSMGYPVVFTTWLCVLDPSHSLYLGHPGLEQHEGWSLQCWNLHSLIFFNL